MGVVAPTEKQVLADPVGDARALIDAGEYEAALDLLASAREDARTKTDRSALVEITRLEGTVWRSRPPRAWTPGLGTWSLVVVIGWLVASVVAVAEVSGSTESHSFVSPDLGIAVLLLFFTLIAPVVWLLGVLLFAAWRRIVQKRTTG